VNAIQKPLPGLKNVLQKPHEHLKSFGSGFTELHAKLDADTLLNFAIHGRQNETGSRKSTRVKTMLVHSAMSCGSDAIGLRKYDLGLPSHLISPRQLQQ
jgi:hypothetical protein